MKLSNSSILIIFSPHFSVGKLPPNYKSRLPCQGSPLASLHILKGAMQWPGNWCQNVSYQSYNFLMTNCQSLQFSLLFCCFYSCAPKSFSKIFLYTQLWKILTNPSSMCASSADTFPFVSHVYRYVFCFSNVSLLYMFWIHAASLLLLLPQWCNTTTQSAVTWVVGQRRRWPGPKWKTPSASVEKWRLPHEIQQSKNFKFSKSWHWAQIYTLCSVSYPWVLNTNCLSQLRLPWQNTTDCMA